jgi:hypothetical protein
MAWTIPYHVDGLDAQRFRQLDYSLAHSRVGTVLDHKVTFAIKESKEATRSALDEKRGFHSLNEKT